ncbi:GNAT family N-acetyltransferase [Nocardioides acrostichi]|uniref:N-acetyltransferase domain-containing protein n=1 Tax=Nocardioides acrostichi TaxID=2784339 RepID=A0A930YE22_9ACTN|nr:GNAT family N-acetyltransferase [Nocardioides acrostichi]MBF4163059.1 hypothetical protein [Nocardioides acrostichi]
MSRLIEAAARDAATLAGVRAIYEDAFPADLRADFESLLSDRLVVRVDAGGAPEGFALVRALGDTGWTFLRYYAVGVRGGGIGSAMLDELCALLAGEGGALLVWDVEDPDEPGLSAAHVEEHRRRIAFYERNGGVLLPVRDYAPPHGADLDGHDPALRLMCRVLDGGPTPPAADVLLAAMTLRYEVPADHPAVQRALASLS